MANLKDYTEIALSVGHKTAKIIKERIDRWLEIREKQDDGDLDYASQCWKEMGLEERGIGMEFICLFLDGRIKFKKIKK